MADPAATRSTFPVSQECRSQVLLATEHPALAPRLAVATPDDASWTARSLARVAIRFPRLGRAASALAFPLATLCQHVAGPAFADRVSAQGWCLAVWSGVREPSVTSKADRKSRRERAPVLVYHRVCDDPNPALREWAVRPAAFRRQMRLLRWLGYRPITLQSMIDALEYGHALDRVAVITFDDGYLDTATVAAPILGELGIPATVFVVPDRVGKTAAWDEPFGGGMAPLASWSQLRDLQHCGWEIGLHTRTHPDLNRLSVSAVRAEFVDGKVLLERELGVTVRTAAYPYGEYAATAMVAAAEAGLDASTTIDGGHATRTSHRHALPRMAVMRHDTLVDVALMLWTGRRLKSWAGTGRRVVGRRWRRRSLPPGLQPETGG